MINIDLTDKYFAEKSNAIQALYNVIDPELHINVVDLGLIYNIEFTENQQIHLQMTLSIRFCPMGDSITNGVKNALLQAFPQHEVNVELVWEPEWAFERISDEGKQQLGII